MKTLKQFDLYKFMDNLDNSYPDVDKHTFDSDDEYTSYRDGYTAGLNQAAIYASKITNNLTITIPQDIADWLIVCKENLALNLASAMNPIVLRTNHQSEKTIEWFKSAKNQETFAKAWLFDYNIKKEKLYTARFNLSNDDIEHSYINQQLDNDNKLILNNLDENPYVKTKFTQEELKCLGLWENPLIDTEDAPDDASLKEFIVSGYHKDGLVFCFDFNCSNSAQAVQIASQDELIQDMDFDKLIIKEKHK